MVHPHESRAAWNERRRVEDTPSTPPGRAPFAGEIMGGHARPPFAVHGMRALGPMLDHVRFPATKIDILTAIGDARIALDVVKTASVREIVERLGPERFATRADLEAAAGRILREMQPHYEDGRGARHK